jgi:hypothetical protein
MPLPPNPALGSLPSVALPSGQAQTNYHTLIKWQDKLPKMRGGGIKMALFTVKKTQGEVEIGAASFRCELIGYHLKLDSFLS